MTQISLVDSSINYCLLIIKSWVRLVLQMIPHPLFLKEKKSRSTSASRTITTDVSLLAATRSGTGTFNLIVSAGHMRETTRCIEERQFHGGGAKRESVYFLLHDTRPAQVCHQRVLEQDLGKDVRRSHTRRKKRNCVEPSASARVPAEKERGVIWPK